MTVVVLQNVTLTTGTAMLRPTDSIIVSACSKFKSH